MATGNCANDLDAYLIGSHPNTPNSLEDMPSSDQTSAAQITTVDDTDYKMNEIEENVIHMLMHYGFQSCFIPTEACCRMLYMHDTPRWILHATLGGT